MWKRLEEELKRHDTSLRSLHGDGWSVRPLDEREFRVLSAVAKAGEGTVIDILKILENWDPGMMIGTVLLVLDSLQRREFVVETQNGSDKSYHANAGAERALARARIEGRQLVAAERSLKGTCPENT